MNKFLQQIGKIVGAISGAVVCLSWGIAMWTPTPELPLTGISFFVAMFMAFMAILATIASIKGHGTALFVLFFLSFFPIGYFTLSLQGWVQIIGYLNLGYLFSGLVAWRLQPGSEQTGSV